MISNEQLKNKADEIWKSAIKLRGKFKAYEYQDVILPVILLRRIECVLEDKRKETEEALLQGYPEYRITEKEKPKAKKKKTGELQKLIKETECDEFPFWNKTKWTLLKIVNDNAKRIEKNFRDYINGFSPNIEEMFEKFEFASTIKTMEKNDVLESILRQYATEPLGPKDLSNLEMGYVYEELLRKFSEQSGEEAGEHFTPREVIRLMVELLDIQLSPKNKNKAISIYDPACGTGGMLSVAKEHILENAESDKERDLIQTVVELYGQERQSKNYAICKADMMMKAEEANRITHGNSLVPDEEGYKERGDYHDKKKFDYMLSNPPFGVNWSEYAARVKKLSYARYKGQFPTIKDGALLFLMTMIQKMKTPKEGASKIAIIFNGSPLSNGDAESGESEIRRHVLENDLLDCIVMLPDQLFYNTGIFTYIWILSNTKPEKKKQKVLIINARKQFSDEPKSMGQKRHRLEEIHRKWIKEHYDQWQENDFCKIFDYHDFAFHKVEVVFWQTDENDTPAWIKEPFPTKVNNKNVNEKVAFYGGDATFHASINTSTAETAAETQFEFSLTSKEQFIDVFAEQLKNKFPEQTKELKIGEIFKWWQNTYETKTSVLFTHRQYITDFEYIPFNENIKTFVEREIDKPIISISNTPQLGYEILPNKYFFQYEEPSKAEDVLKEFWELEKEAEVILCRLEGNNAKV
jgi:type I restriction enzyme M protein